MSVLVSKGYLRGNVTPPSTKSYAHRAIFLAAASGRRTTIENVTMSEDVSATVNCMIQLGCEITCLDSTLIINPTYLGSIDNVTLDARESGTTLRLLLPFVCTLGINVEIVGRGRLSERPLTELVEELRRHGAQISDVRLPLKVYGNLRPSAFSIVGGISSQYISGLMIALSRLSGQSTLSIEGRVVSDGYIRMTEEMMKVFGIGIQKSIESYLITPNSGKTEIKVALEADWSSAAFWLVAGALCGDLSIENVNGESLQPDRKILSALRNMGADIVTKGDTVIVKQSRLSCVDFDITDCPDCAPILSLAMAAAKGISKMFGVDRLRAKESDRLAAIQDMLDAIFISHRYEDGVLYIIGGRAKGGVIRGYGDHRMVMSGVIAGAYSGNVTVTDESAVAKSYPKFFADFSKIGGKYELLR